MPALCVWVLGPGAAQSLLLYAHLHQLQWIWGRASHSRLWISQNDKNCLENRENPAEGKRQPLFSVLENVFLLPGCTRRQPLSIS